MNSHIKTLLMGQITRTSRWALTLLAAQSFAVAAHATSTYKYSTNLTAAGTVISPGTTKVVPRLLPTSTFKFGSDGTLTVTLKGVRDAGGNVVNTTSNTTDPFVVSGDEYIVTVHAAPLDAPALEFELTIPVELKKGAGKTVVDLQYLTDQGLNYLHNTVGANASGAVATKSILVWAPSPVAIMSPDCANALTRPKTAPSWVGGFLANYWLPPASGGPVVNPCTSGAAADVVGLAGIAVQPGSGVHGGGCQIGLPGSGTMGWLLLLPALGLLMKRRPKLAPR